MYQQVERLLIDNYLGGMIGKNKLDPLTNANLIRFGFRLNEAKNPSRLKSIPWTKHFLFLRKNQDDTLVRVQARYIHEAALLEYGKQIIDQSTDIFHYENGYYYYGVGDEGDGPNPYIIEHFTSAANGIYEAKGTGEHGLLHWHAMFKSRLIKNKKHLILTHYDERWH